MYHNPPFPVRIISIDAKYFPSSSDNNALILGKESIDKRKNISFIYIEGQKSANKIKGRNLCKY